MKEKKLVALMAVQTAAWMVSMKGEWTVAHLVVGLVDRMESCSVDSMAALMAKSSVARKVGEKALHSVVQLVETTAAKTVATMVWMMVVPLVVRRAAT